MIRASSILSISELVSILDLGDEHIPLTQDGELESLDLNAAALAEADPMMERSRLISREFVHARFGRWETQVDQVITIMVYEFNAVQQAFLSVADIHETLRAAGAKLLNGDTHRDPAVSLTSVTSTEDGETFRSVLCALASNEFQVLVVTGAPLDSKWLTPKQLHSVAQIQAAKLLT